MTNYYPGANIKRFANQLTQLQSLLDDGIRFMVITSHKVGILWLGEIYDSDYFYIIHGHYGSMEIARASIEHFPGSKIIDIHESFDAWLLKAIK